MLAPKTEPTVFPKSVFFGYWPPFGVTLAAIRLIWCNLVYHLAPFSTTVAAIQPIWRHLVYHFPFLLTYFCIFVGIGYRWVPC